MNPGYWGWGKMMYLCKKQVGENMNLWPRTKKIHVGCSRLEVLSLTAVRCFKQNGCQMKNRNSVTVPVITIWIFSFLSLWCTCKTPSEGGELSWAFSLAVWRNGSVSPSLWGGLGFPPTPPELGSPLWLEHCTSGLLLPGVISHLLQWLPLGFLKVTSSHIPFSRCSSSLNTFWESASSKYHVVAHRSTFNGKL